MKFDMTTSDGLLGSGTPLDIDKTIYYFARKHGLTILQLEELEEIIAEYKKIVGVKE